MWDYFTRRNKDSAEAEAEEEEDEGECTFDDQNNSTDEIYDTDTCDIEDEI